MSRATRIRGTAFVAAAAFGLSGQAVAQARPKPPAPKPPPAYVFPKVQTQTLPNGLVVHVIENHALPLVAVRAVIEGGVLLDPVGKEGLFTLDTLLVRDGTTTMNGDALADAISELGASVSPSGFTTVADQLERSLSLLGDMLMHPTLPADALERRRATLASTMQRVEGQAATPANRIFNVEVFGADHPLGRPATPVSLGAITPEDVARFHAEHVRPENVTLVMVGDILPASAMALATKVFGGWQRSGNRAVVNAPLAPSPKATTIYLLDRPGASQSTIYLGQAGPPRSAPDAYALDVASFLFGGGSGSRLWTALRDRRPLTYGVTHVTRWRGANEPSSILGQSSVDAAKTDSALITWIGELKELATGRAPSEQEVVFGRSVTAGNLATRLETFDAIADKAAQMARDHLPMTYLDGYVRGINAATPADVGRAAAHYFDPAHTAIVIVGDRKTIEAPLREANIAPIVIVDASGRVVP